MKLRGIGLDIEELPLATGSDSIRRIEIMKLAEHRGLSGRSAARRTYVGDGPWDKASSEELGYDFVAIGHSVKHDVQFSDLSAHSAILEQLGLV